jgi:hypothetical protein
MPFLGSSASSIRVDASGTLSWWDTTVARGTSSSGVVVENQWQMVSWEYSAGRMKLYLDGNLLFETSTAVGSPPMNWGNSFGNTDTFDLYIDDISIDNSVRPEEAKIVALLPVSDNAVGSGWEKPGGATTNLYTSLNNVPPVGVADSTSATYAENFVRNPAAVANSDLDLNMMTYADAGIASTDVIRAIELLVMTSVAVSTSPKTIALGIISNPVSGWNGSLNPYETTAAGTEPTGWKRIWESSASFPSVTRSSNPVVRLRQVTSSTRILMVEYAAIMVEYWVTPVVSNFTADAMVQRTFAFGSSGSPVLVDNFTGATHDHLEDGRTADTVGSWSAAYKSSYNVGASYAQWDYVVDNAGWASFIADSGGANDGTDGSHNASNNYYIAGTVGDGHIGALVGGHVYTTHSTSLFLRRSAGSFYLVTLSSTGYLNVDIVDAYNPAGTLKSVSTGITSGNRYIRAEVFGYNPTRIVVHAWPEGNGFYGNGTKYIDILDSTASVQRASGEVGVRATANGTGWYYDVDYETWYSVNTAYSPRFSKVEAYSGLTELMFGDGFTADAWIAAPQGPTWVSPSDGARIQNGTPLVFTSLSAATPQHFQIALDTADTFNSGNLVVKRSYMDSGFEYWDGSAWQTLTSAGMPANKTGNNVRYTPGNLSLGTWYRRVRQG